MGKPGTYAAWTVIVVWTISMVIDMIPSIEYEPPVAIYPALMLALGAIFGIKISKADSP